MSAFSEATRSLIASRAGHRCEYCRIPTRGQVATFPIDHVIPVSQGGPTESANLALACPHCNAHKWAFTESPDPETGESVGFFHPRTDAWHDHFEWSRMSRSELLGRTPVGRATIDGLRINADDMIALRRLLIDLGLFTEPVE